jgi:putative ABC transport system permease protein
MYLLSLAVESLKNRMMTSLLTVFSVGLSSCLLLSVEKIKRTSEESFTGSISQTDLIVGGKTSPINLLLYTVFNIGSPSNNVSAEAFEKFKSHSAVEWAIPISLGDGHKGFRVVGTNQDYFKHFRFHGDKSLDFQQGGILQSQFDAVIGDKVASQLNYKLGDKIVLSHGVTNTEGFIHHDQDPFVVAGILKSTGTLIDRTVFVSQDGLANIHREHNGDSQNKGESEKVQNDLNHPAAEYPITAFFVRTKNRIEVLSLQREINEYKTEPLLATIPGVALAELWQGLGYFENALMGISWMVLVSGMVSMLIALLSTLNERRREMAILRALGASLNHISALLLIESFLLTLLGVFCGVGLHLLLFNGLAGILETEFGIYVTQSDFVLREYLILFSAVVLGFLVGLIPAYRSMKLSLKDGLSVRL